MNKENSTDSKIYQELRLLLTKNCFEVFDLTPSFNVDQKLLTQQYYQKQKTYHPDNFIKLIKSSQTTTLSSLNVQVSAHINDAYYILTHDLTRAIALLKIYGVALDLAKDTSLPPEFLLEQMEIYEAIDDLKSECANQKNDAQLIIAKFDRLQYNIQASIGDLLAQLKSAFDHQLLDSAILNTKKLSCYLKLNSRIIDIEY